jgi:hypothetical protein
LTGYSPILLEGSFPPVGSPTNGDIRDAVVLRVTAGGIQTHRWATIDLLKGFAILCVLLIHSKALGDSVGFLYVVNRAVPIFVILFGLNSTFWWRDRLLPQHITTWYSTRIRRMMLPYWASLPLWWILALWYHPFGVAFPWWLSLVQVCGYTLYMGTGWFVTMILLLVALFPLLELGVRRAGVWPVLVATVAGELIVAHWRLPLIDRFGLMNFLVFPPRMLGHVAFGMLLATRMDKLGTVECLAGVALWTLCVGVGSSSPSPQLGPYIDTLIDFPLAVALLVAFRVLPVVPLVTPALLWLGVNSWGVYLGQMLIHNWVVYRCGFLSDLAPNFLACNFPLGGDQVLGQWFFTLILLIGAIGLIGLARGFVLAALQIRAKGEIITRAW